MEGDRDEAGRDTALYIEAGILMVVMLAAAIAGIRSLI